MNAFKYLILGLAFTAHAVSAQSFFWQTTHQGSSDGPCHLELEKITVTLNQFSADVEEEAQLRTEGSVWSGDSMTLEIVGRFSLSDGSSLRSMLLWNGSKILKAKLLSRADADSNYEQVVDRDAVIPEIRDPALIEYLGNNEYSIKIYPVTIGKSRKIRILYTVPLKTLAGKSQFSIIPAFVLGSQNAPSHIPVSFRTGDASQSNYELHSGTTVRPLQHDAIYMIPHDDFYYYWGNNPLPLRVILKNDRLPVVACAHIDTGKTAGYYYAIFSKIPDTLSVLISEASASVKNTIEATVKIGNNTYIFDLSEKSSFDAYMKTPDVWDSTITWRVYDNRSDLIVTHNQVIIPESTNADQKNLPLLWAANYTHTEKSGNLGALYGFVDREMSLLALESDTLPQRDAIKYQEEGVPLLNPEDINTKKYPIPPNENIIFFGNTATVADKLARPTFSVAIINNLLLELQFASKRAGTIQIRLIDISGKTICSWNKNLQGQKMQLQLPKVIKGIYILQVKAGKECMQKKVVFKYDY